MARGSKIRRIQGGGHQTTHLKAFPACRDAIFPEGEAVPRPYGKLTYELFKAGYELVEDGEGFFDGLRLGHIDAGAGEQVGRIF